jgi:hypothetical protein
MTSFETKVWMDRDVARRILDGMMTYTESSD